MTDVLTFFCPNCATKLTVPASMAGVTGPCPSCGVVVQAPYAMPAPPSQAAAPFASPPASQPYQVQETTPEPAPLPPGPKGSHAWEPKNVRPRVAESPEIVARGVAEYSPGERHTGKLPPQPASRRPNTLFRLAMCLLVAGVMAAVFIGMKKWLAGDPNETAEIAKKPFPKPLPNDPKPLLPTNEKAETTVPPVAPPPAANTTAPDAADTFSKLTQPASAETASEALDKFLKAKTLEERLPLMETRLKPADLAATVLAKPLPPDPLVERYMQETNNAGKFSDWYYNLDFPTASGNPNLQMLMIRVDMKGQAKIFVDPFLDSYGGRLAAYAEKPSSQPGTFQVVVSAIARCYAKDKVPNAEQKLTLKLLPRENAPMITEAYFTQLSKISDMLKDSTSGFRYGEARPCRVTLRWNTEENPKMPYLEAVSLNELRWNP